MAGTQKKKPWLIILAIILLAAGSWLLRPESQEAINLKAELRATITEQIGEKSNMDKERIDGISVSQVSTGWNAEIDLHADKGFTMTSTKQSMWQQAITILAPLSEINQLNDITISWIYPVEGWNHEVNGESVMSFRMDKATRDQLIWENVDPSVLPDIAFDYQEHPILNE